MNHSTIARTLVRGIRLSAVAALLTGLLAVTQPALADTYSVTNTNNSGPGSLRQAITNANINPGADIITFNTAINGNPIVLAGAVGDDSNASGDLDILDGGDLTIQGNGAGNTIIDGRGIYRVFHVCPGGSCANTVTFIGVTIRNGNTTNQGGGIYNEVGTVTVDSSTVSSNSADSHGGGIFNKYGTLTIQNGSIIGGAGAGNTSSHGGGIYNNDGTTTVNGSTVNTNSAIYGGGIYNKGTTTVVGSTISANTGGLGGGIYNYGTVMVYGSRILNNTATSIGEGGGVYNDSNVAGATSVTGSCIVGNSDVSFYNYQPALQIATSNWWGAATGPNTPGADTVSRNVNTSGHLTEPILGCGFDVYLPLVLK